MSSAAVAPAGPGKGTGKLKAFTEARGWKKWTALNDPALKALVSDKDAQEDRLWALAVLRSWGAPSGPKECAVDPNSEKRLRLSDLYRELGVPKQTGNRWAHALAAKNRLHALDSGVYPVDDPTKAFELANGTKKSGSLGLFPAKYKIFKEEWKKSHPAEAKRESDLRAELKTLKKKKLAEYKAWLKSQAPMTPESQAPVSNEENGPGLPTEAVPDSVGFSPTLPNSAAPPNKEEEKTSIAGDPSSSSFGQQINKTTTIHPKGAKLNQADAEIAIVEETLSRYCRPEDVAPKLIRLCRQNAPDCTAEEIAELINEKGELIESAKKPIGFVLEAIPKCFKGDFRRHLRSHQKTRYDQARSGIAEYTKPTGLSLDEKLNDIRITCELFEGSGPESVNRKALLGWLDLAAKDPDVIGELRDRVMRCLGMQEGGQG